MAMIDCAGCDKPILDKFIFNVIDRSWHQSCIKCIDCKVNLNDKCFSREDKLYCKNDFYKRFGPKCCGCHKVLCPSDLIRRAKDKIFHIKCFTCYICQKELTTGDQLFMLDDFKFICKYDYYNNNPNQNIKIREEYNEDGIKYYSTDRPSLCLIQKEHSPTVLINKHEQHFFTSIDDFKGSTFHLDSSAEKENLLVNSTVIDSSTSSLSNEQWQVTAASSAIGLKHETSIEELIDSENEEVEDVDDEDDLDDDDDDSDQGLCGKSSLSKDDINNSNGKKRGPRTTIKAKQLEMLKSAFAATPKPTRHIREQLAQETGLNMRVIQVWFQNRRSKERRMKQLSAMGNRRHYYRNSSRLVVNEQQQQTNQNRQQLTAAESLNISLNRFNEIDVLNNGGLSQNVTSYVNSEFYGQNSFNDFMIQNERLNYPHSYLSQPIPSDAPSLVNSESSFNINVKLAKCSPNNSPINLDQNFTTSSSATLTSNYIQTTNTSDLESVW